MIKTNRVLLAVFVMFVLVTTGLASTVVVPSEEWNRTYGESELWTISSMEYTRDGGYVIAGGDPNSFIMKADSLGNEIWNKTFISGYSQFLSVDQTTDNGYIAAGWDNNEGNSARLFRIDESGNEQWNKTFGWKAQDRFYSVRQTSDGGYIAAGFTQFDHHSQIYAWLVKTDSLGNEVWNKRLGIPNSWGSTSSVIYSVIQTSDGGYAMTGIDNYYVDVLFIKTDMDGNVEWQKLLGGVEYDIGKDIEQTSDGGYIIGGGAGIHNPYIIKTDKYGNVQWQKIFTEMGGTVVSIRQTSDGRYIFSNGHSVVVMDNNGDKQWDMRFEGDISAVVQTLDGGYALAGKIYRIDYDVLLIKLSRDTDAGPIPPTPELSTFTLITIGLIGLITLARCRRNEQNE